jgi:phospholipid-transporting ATPase
MSRSAAGGPLASLLQDCEYAPIPSPETPKQQARTVKFGSTKVEGETFPDNTIKTTKYTWYTFLPLNLWEQLQKFGNVYFLFVSMLMYLGERTTLFVGTIKAFSTLGTLVMMMAVTAVTAALDDKKRGQADKHTNEQKATTVTQGVGSRQTGEKQWQDVRVGDVLLVEQDQEFPADMVPLYCTGDQGTCYVSTANLDGETNLKLKEAAPSSYTALGGRPGLEQPSVLSKLPELKFNVEAEPPNKSIHEFKGTLSIGPPESSKTEPLGGKHLLLRGTVLRNTKWCVGIVIYTGTQTRMVMNTRKAPSKQSTLEQVTNTVMFVVLGAQAFLALVSDIIFLQASGDYRTLWYLIPPHVQLPESVAYWLTFFVLYSNMMPISLYPTMEACNMVQAYFIRQDAEMYDLDLEGDRPDFGANVRSSNLCQEIGQVAYIFSDKTGTLTQNVMELKRIAIPGIEKPGVYKPYGELTATKGFSGTEALLQDFKAPANQSKIGDFMEVLAVAHTVMATKDAKAPKGWKYEAESPDEGALVEAVRDLGWAFAGRVGTTMTVEHFEQTKQDYVVEAVNAFDSTRKRMSILVSKKTDDSTKYSLFVKGADNVMIDNAAASSDGERADLANRLAEFSRQGLRTLVIGRRDLDEAGAKEWLTQYKEAERDLQDREGKLTAAALKIEKDWKIVGATAIEVKLQVGVPEAIVKIRQAGMKLWVLTGDKLETARNIGFSANVLSDSMLIETLDKPPKDGELEDILKRLSAAKQSGKTGAFMITGAALEVVAATESMEAKLLEVAMIAQIVIGCRVSPLQKAQMVRLVRDGVKPTPVTLAIGDGANDVPMIQEAQVGVGIAGREGRQSVNNSDFAIGQFRFLERLLLVHGRWNYLRVCKFTLFTFWRNAVQVLMIFYYTWISGFSGTCLFEDWIRMSFNFLCSLPIIATGCFDQDIPDHVALTNPECYRVGSQGLALNATKIVESLIGALTHSIVIMGVLIAAFPGMDIVGAGDYYTFGTAVYSCLLVDMNYRVVFLNYTHNQYTVGAVLASFVLYVVWLLGYPCTSFIANLLTPNMYMVPLHMVQNMIFPVCLIAVPALAMTIDMSIMAVYQRLNEQTKYVDELRAKWFKEKLQTKQMIEGCGCRWSTSQREVNIEEQGEPQGSGGRSKDVDFTPLAQQKLDNFHFDTASFSVVTWSLGIGFLLLLLGCWTSFAASQTVQLRVHYFDTDGGRPRSIFQSSDPLGTDEDTEVVNALGECQGTGPNGTATTTCTKTFTIPKTMRQPILVYYSLGPYYQNYNDYLKSEVVPELMGRDVDPAVRHAKCLEPVRRTGDKDIVPCGMIATSFFNDTFKLEAQHGPIDIDSSNVAWASDVERYTNPPDYRQHRDDTSWLDERYPDVIGSEGVDNPIFVAWMRPSALNRVWNPYGYISEDLEAGTNVTLTIGLNYPMDSVPHAWKHVVLTTFNSFGGRQHLFGWILIGGGAICCLLALLVKIFLYKRVEKAEE